MENIAKIGTRFWECSIIRCEKSTTSPQNPDPRKRWIVDLVLEDEDGKFYKLNLCPKHVLESFPGVNEEFFERTERTERFVKSQTEMIQ